MPFASLSLLLGCWARILDSLKYSRLLLPKFITDSPEYGPIYHQATIITLTNRYNNFSHFHRRNTGVRESEHEKLSSRPLLINEGAKIEQVYKCAIRRSFDENGQIHVHESTRRTCG